MIVASALPFSHPPKYLFPPAHPHPVPVPSYSTTTCPPPPPRPPPHTHTGLDKILIERDEAGAIEYVKGIIRDLLMNKVDMSLLVVTKVSK